MSKIFTERQRDLLIKTEKIKEQVLDSYYKKVEHHIDEDAVETIVKITDSIEKGIERTAKLEILKEKNEIEKQGNDNMEAVFNAIHESRSKRLAEADPTQDEENQDYKPANIKLQAGELKLGEDNIDYEEFLKKDTGSDDRE